MRKVESANLARVQAEEGHMREMESAAWARVQAEEDHRAEMESAAWARVEAEERERLERKEQENRLTAARNLLAECIIGLSELESEFPVGAVVSENNRFILRVAALQAKIRLLKLKEGFFSELEEMKEMHSIRARVIGYISGHASAGSLTHDPFEATHKRLEELSNAFDYCNSRINNIFNHKMVPSGASEESLNQVIRDLDAEMESLSDIQRDVSDRLKSQGFNSLKSEMPLLSVCAIDFTDQKFLDYSAYVNFQNFAKGEGGIADQVIKRYEKVRSDVLGMIELNKIHKKNIESAIAYAKSGSLYSASSLFEKLGEIRFADVNYTLAQAAIQELSLALKEFEMCKWYPKDANEGSLIRHLNKYKAASPFGFFARKTYEDFRRAKRNRLIVKIVALGVILVLFLMVRKCIGGRVVSHHGSWEGIAGGIGDSGPSGAINADMRNDSVDDFGNRSELLMDFRNIDLPVLVVVVKGCALRDSIGKERDIAVGKRLRIFNRKENGILGIDVEGAFYVGHESRIFGNVKILDNKNKLESIVPQFGPKAENTDELPSDEQQQLPVDRGAGLAKAELEAKLKLARAELAEVNAEIAAERARWHNALALINQLTSNKTRPVREGSPEYNRCLEASRVIQEVEAGAPKLKAKRAGLEAEIMELEK